MTKRTSASKPIYFAAALAAAIALSATTGADAKHRRDDGMSMSGDRSDNWKEGSHKKDKSASKKTCRYITADGKRCGQKPVKTTTTKKNCLYITADGKHCGHTTPIQTTTTKKNCLYITADGKRCGQSGTTRRPSPPLMVAVTVSLSAR